MLRHLPHIPPCWPYHTLHVIFYDLDVKSSTPWATLAMRQKQHFGDQSAPGFIAVDLVWTSHQKRPPKSRSIHASVADRFLLIRSVFAIRQVNKRPNEAGTHQPKKKKKKIEHRLKRFHYLPSPSHVMPVFAGQRPPELRKRSRNHRWQRSFCVCTCDVGRSLLPMM